MISFRQTVLFTVGCILFESSSNIFANAQATPTATNFAISYDFPVVDTNEFVHAICVLGASSAGATSDDPNLTYTSIPNFQNGIQIWDDRSYVMSGIQGDEKCEGGIFLQPSRHKIIDQGTKISVGATSVDAGQVTICAIISSNDLDMENNLRNGKWDESLPSDGFTPGAELSWASLHGTNLMRIYSKSLDTPTASPTSSPTPNPTATPTASPTSSPTPNPTATPTANPTSSPTPNPTATPTASPTSSPTVTNSLGGNALGDPHFKTFQDIFFSYHAACDILLLASVMHEVMIQIRTTRVDTHRRHQSSYSYISQAAVKIQDVILEVSADGILLINGEDSSDSVPASIADGYAGLTKTIKGTKRNIISYKVDLGNGRSIDLRSNIKTGMMYIDVDGHFSDSEGLLGPSGGEHGLYSRDGTIMDMAAEGAYNSYSQSWQVLSDEPMLFQEARFPQHPLGCCFTAVPATASSNLRRRLTDVVEVSKEDAMKACADAVPGDKMDFCVTDVMLTGDLDAAEDEFYYLN